jgi:hypothetical protein
MFFGSVSIGFMSARAPVLSRGVGYCGAEHYAIDESRQPLATNRVEVTLRPVTELGGDQQSHRVLATVKCDPTFEAGRGTRPAAPTRRQTPT